MFQRPVPARMQQEAPVNKKMNVCVAALQKCSGSRLFDLLIEAQFHPHHEPLYAKPVCLKIALVARHARRRVKMRQSTYRKDRVPYTFTINEQRRWRHAEPFVESSFQYVPKCLGINCLQYMYYTHPHFSRCITHMLYANVRLDNATNAHRQKTKNKWICSFHDRDLSDACAFNVHRAPE